METVVKKLYEGLFLVDSGQAAADWDGINAAIEKALARADAEVVSIQKWDERRLAYSVKGNNRGTYILAYFNGDPAKVAMIERDVQLSEQIVRVLILRTDKMSKEDIEKDTPLAASEKQTAQAASEKQTAQAESEKTEANDKKEEDISDKTVTEPAVKNEESAGTEESEEKQE